MRIGIDLGGTKIEGVLLEGSAERARLRADTPRGDYDATLAAIASLVGELERGLPASGSGLQAVGIGIPGTLARDTGFVKNANSTWLIGRPLRQDLEARLGRPVRIANDANCFAISEATDGAAAGADVVFGVILGTGVGGGVVVNGRVIDGANGIAGEWGHNPLPWPEADECPGPDCYCGRRGCIETFLSGPGMSADHERHTGARLASLDIEARAAAGDVQAEQTLVRYEQRLARALATIINVLDPDVIVLGGGMSNIDRLYTKVPALWSRHVFAAEQASFPAARSPKPEAAVRTRLARAAHGAASGVRGAAFLWP